MYSTLFNGQYNSLTESSHNKRGKLQPPHCLIWTKQVCYWQMKVTTSQEGKARKITSRLQPSNLVLAENITVTEKEKKSRESDIKDMREHKVLLFKV